MEPITEFRTLSITADEPADRTAAGTVVDAGAEFSLGEIDTTDEPQHLPIRVFWWRAADMGDAAEITNIRVWMDGTGGLTGTNQWYMDITDTWTKGKTPIQVMTGTPGNAPLSRPAPNLTAIGDGPITGTGHGQTSKYIYLAGRIGLDETTGEKTGLSLHVTYDYH